MLPSLLDELTDTIVRPPLVAPLPLYLLTARNQQFTKRYFVLTKYLFLRRKSCFVFTKYLFVVRIFLFLPRKIFFLSRKIFFLPRKILFLPRKHRFPGAIATSSVRNASSPWRRFTRISRNLQQRRERVTRDSVSSAF